MSEYPPPKGVTCLVGAKITPQERRSLAAVCNAKNLTVSEVVREAIINYLARRNLKLLRDGDAR